MLDALKRTLLRVMPYRFDEDNDGAGSGGRGGTNKSGGDRGGARDAGHDGDESGNDSGSNSGGEQGSSEAGTGGGTAHGDHHDYGEVSAPDPDPDPGKALEQAEQASTAGWGQARYDDTPASPTLHDVLGSDGTAQDLANRLKQTPAGFDEDGKPIARTDREVSEALSNSDVGYLDRARAVGPIDAIAQGPLSSALSRAVEAGLALANPMAGAAMTLGDAVVDGAASGQWGRMGHLLGGALGARAGLDIASGFANSANGALAAAIAGPALGGALGAGLGRAIGSGQGSVPGTPAPATRQDGNGSSSLAAGGLPTLARPSAAPAPAADGMGHSFYDYLARYGGGSSVKG